MALETMTNDSVLIYRRRTKSVLTGDAERSSRSPMGRQGSAIRSQRTLAVLSGDIADQALSKRGRLSFFSRIMITLTFCLFQPLRLSRMH